VAVSLAPVATVVVTPADPTVAVAKTITLAARLTDAAGNELSGRTVTWSSSNTGTATVTSAGVVRGIKRGSVTITATSEGKKGSTTVKVQ
jgi:uncharacterized protein YjdB